MFQQSIGAPHGASLGVREKAPNGCDKTLELDRLGVELVAHQIARGAKPSEMPIEQSLRFHMAVNLKTAASLGVSLSDSFVARANEVRE